MARPPRSLSCYRTKTSTRANRYFSRRGKFGGADLQKRKTSTSERGKSRSPAVSQIEQRPFAIQIDLGVVFCYSGCTSRTHPEAAAARAKAASFWPNLRFADLEKWCLEARVGFGAGGIRTHEWRFCRPLPWPLGYRARRSQYIEKRARCVSSAAAALVSGGSGESRLVSSVGRQGAPHAGIAPTPPAASG